MDAKNESRNLTSYFHISVYQNIELPDPASGNSRADEIANLILYVNASIVCTSIASLGIVGNIFNIAAFVKQGFRETINISLVSLAVADLGSLVTLLWLGIAADPSFNALDLPFSPNEVLYLTGSVPRVYFTRISSLITAYIAVERSLCVLKPLKVKFLFTRKVLLILLTGGILVLTVAVVPFYYSARLAWKYDFRRNRSYVGLMFRSDKHKVDSISLVVGVVISFSSFITVTICTFLLVTSLLKQRQWRSSMTSSIKSKDNSRSEVTNEDSRKEKETAKGSEAADAKAAKDNRVVKTVTLLAVMFVVCYFPNTVSQIVMLIIPEFNRSGRLANYSNVMWSFGIIAEALCASCNIFVYLFSSSRYRESLLEVFEMCWKRNGRRRYG